MKKYIKMTGKTFSASKCPVHCEYFWVWQRIYGLLGDHLTGEKLCRAQLYWPLGLGTVLSSAPLTHLGSSFSLVSLTLCKAGWWYSALEFSKLSAVELAISISISLISFVFQGSVCCEAATDQKLKNLHLTSPREKENWGLKSPLKV